MSRIIATRWYTLSDGSCIGVVALHTNDHEPDAPYEWKAYIGHALGLSHTSDEQQIASLGIQLPAIEARAYFPALALERYKDDESRTSTALAETTRRALGYVAGLESRLHHLKTDQAYVGVTRADVRLLRAAISDQAPAMLANEMSVNGVPIDPMIGYYDRVWAEGDPDKIAMHRNIPALIGYEIHEPFSIEKYKKHLVENSYASQETVEAFWPEKPIEEK